MMIDLRAVTAAARGMRAAEQVGVLDGLRGEAAAITLDALRTAAPLRAGNLRRSITARPVSGGTGFFAVAYSALVVSGTKPHLILPRRRRALAWPGARHPVAFVRHPGTKPNDFPRRAAHQATLALRGALVAAGERVIQRIVADA